MTFTSRRLLSCVVSMLVLAGCGPAGGVDEVEEGVAQARQSLAVDDAYAQLRSLETLLPLPAPTATVNVGTMSSSGVFSGLTTTYSIDPFSHKPIPMTPIASINGVDLILSFSAPGSGNMTVTANGITVNSYTGVATVNVGRARSVNWSLQAFGLTRSDKLNVSRSSVLGAGAFTLAALPVSIVYEPPQNVARTNAASMTFRTEMTTIQTVTKGSGTTSAPKWATGVVMSDIFNRLANHVGIVNAAKQGLSAVKTLMGSVDSSTTSGTTVNSDSTLGVSQVNVQTMSTNSHTGPGRGDVVVFYKNARVAWVMEDGEVSLSLLDHGAMGVVTIDTLRSDLAAVNAGQVAPVTGLDAASLTSLIALDPQAVSNKLGSIFGSAPKLPASRFTKQTTLILSGSSFNNSVSHTVTQSDTTSTTNTSTTVKDYHPGWLSLVGIGETKAGTFTSTMTLGSSRTSTISSTVSANLSLSAGAGESYSVDINYDNIFGSFLTRVPPPPPIVLMP